METQTSLPEFETEVISRAMSIREASRSGLTMPLNKLEHDLLASLIHPSARLSVVIPENASADDLIHSLDVAVRSMVWVQNTGRRINPVIGRILYVIQKSPEVYESRGYRSFADFLNSYVIGKLEYSRTSAMESMRLVKAHPNLPIEKWLSIGSHRLSLLTRFTREGEPSYEKFVAAAEQSESSADFKEWAYNRNLLERGEADRTTIVIECNKVLKQHWKNFICDAQVQSTCGSGNPETILQAMLGECSDFMTPEGPRIINATATQVFDDFAAAFVWRCPECDHTGIVPAGYRGKTLDDLLGYVHDAHRDSNKNCDARVGTLLFTRASDDSDEAPID